MEGKNVYLHRLTCEAHHGPAPEGAYALHACDTPACCEPTHLRWGTPQDNQRDRAERSRHKGKLTREDATAIRAALVSGIVGERLAEQYNVSTGMITMIKQGKRWPV